MSERIYSAIDFSIICRNDLPVLILNDSCTENEVFILCQRPVQNAIAAPLRIK